MELDEDGNPIEEEEAPADAEAEKKPKWNPAEFEWTISNRCSKNLPQLFKDYKGVTVDHKVTKSCDIDADDCEAISKALDDFCCRVLDECNAR